MKTILIIPMLVLVGCASYKTKQSDTSYNEKGLPQRTITTEVSTRTIWDSNSALSKSKVTNTDKSQSSSVGSLEQSASSTNGVAALHEVDSILVHAAGFAK